MKKLGRKIRNEECIKKLRHERLELIMQNRLDEQYYRAKIDEAEQEKKGLETRISQLEMQNKLIQKCNIQLSQMLHDLNCRLNIEKKQEKESSQEIPLIKPVSIEKFKELWQFCPKSNVSEKVLTILKSIPEEFRFSEEVLGMTLAWQFKHNPQKKLDRLVTRVMGVIHPDKLDPYNQYTEDIKQFFMVLTEIRDYLRFIKN